MFVMAEVIHGNVYALDGAGRLWRITVAGDGQPEMSLELREFSQEQIKRLAEPRLAQWIRD